MNKPLCFEVQMSSDTLIKLLEKSEKLISVAESPIDKLPNGSLLLYKNKPYFLSRGVDARIVTGADGLWQFVHKLKWKSYRIIYNPITE